MSVLAVVLPIFVLIAVGYLSARFGLLSEMAQKGVAEFAFNFAMPAMLFVSIAHSGSLAPGSWRIAVAYFPAGAGIWLAATLATRHLLGRPAVDAATISITSCFGNIVMVGIPLVLAVVGRDGAAPMAMAMILAIHTPLLWFVGLLQQQSAEHSHRRTPTEMALALGQEFAKNPLLLAILAGTLWRLTGVAVPHGIDTSVSLLAQAGVPCAQIALGASLTRFAIKGQLPTLSLMLALKLVAFPAAVWLTGVELLHLPKAAAEVALIFSSMPAGANAYLFAERTGRAVNSASGAVALGTIFAAITVSTIVALLGPLIGDY